MKKDVTISVPSDLYERAEALAKFKNRTVADILTESINLPDQTLIMKQEQNQIRDKAVEREKQAFIAMHPLLLKRHAGEHVAIYDGQLIDHDKDPAALSRRIYARYPDDFVWIAPVKQQPTEELKFRSPRFLDPE